MGFPLSIIFLHQFRMHTFLNALGSITTHNFQIILFPIFKRCVSEQGISHIHFSCNSNFIVPISCESFKYVFSEIILLYCWTFVRFFRCTSIFAGCFYFWYISRNLLIWDSWTLNCPSVVLETHKFHHDE